MTEPQRELLLAVAETLAFLLGMWPTGGAWGYRKRLDAAIVKMKTEPGTQSSLL